MPVIRRGTAARVFEIADTLLRDLRIAVRGWALAPMFGAGAIATLTVGIAALMSVFLLVNGALLRPLPYPESHRLVGLAPFEDGSSQTGMISRVRLPWRSSATGSGNENSVPPPT